MGEVVAVIGVVIAAAGFRARPHSARRLPLLQPVAARPLHQSVAGNRLRWAPGWWRLWWAASDLGGDPSVAFGGGVVAVSATVSA